MKRKLIWVDVNVSKKMLTPTYYFDFDLLNQIGFPDNIMLSFLEEMKTFAEKEMKERQEEKNEKKD